MRDESRYYCFTDFEKDLTDYVNNKKMRYVYIGEEACPTTGRLHWQGWFYAENPMSKSAVIKMLPRRHVEIMLGTAEENTAYCAKEGKLVLEQGKPPLQGGRRDLTGIQHQLDDGVDLNSIARENFSQWCQYGKRFEVYRQLMEERRWWETEVIYIWGKSGSGKTRLAHEQGAIKIEYDGRFYLNYDGEDIVLFDDIEPMWMNRREFLTMTDRYPHTIPIKGGSRNWKPKTIYLTSNYDPCEIFIDDAMKRRITRIINLN